MSLIETTSLAGIPRWSESQEIATRGWPRLRLPDDLIYIKFKPPKMIIQAHHSLSNFTPFVEQMQDDPLVA
jgi:hypothetical protein